MVRAGVVHDPAQWRWCGYQQIVAPRPRYRLIDRDALAEALALDTCARLASVYRDRIAYLLEHQELTREPQWTEAVAVGDTSFVEKVKRMLHDVRGTWQMLATGAQDETMCLREARSPYSADLGVQNGSLTVGFSPAEHLK